MAANVDEEIDEIVAHDDTECTALLTDGRTNTSDTGNGQSGISRRTRPLTLSTLMHLSIETPTPHPGEVWGIDGGY